MPRNLAQPDDASGRQVGDVNLSEEGQQVVFAHAEELNILDDHHLVVLDLEQRSIDDFLNVGGVAAGQKTQRLFGTLRRAAQTLAIGILAEG